MRDTYDDPEWTRDGAMAAKYLEPQRGAKKEEAPPALAAKQGLVDLLTRIGDTRLQFQNLDQCTKRAQSVRGGVDITFGTSVVTPTELMLGEDEHMGLVVWVKRTDVVAAKEAFKAEHRPPREDAVCEHGTAMDVHCCNCHSGFLFDTNSCVCEEPRP